ncbi:MAG TPA: MerR family transcriptional regulator [Marmoricola sp.]|nr:MerR family transcriptional regulator [Marmoricola sp.]
MSNPRELPSDQGLYPISVIAELTGVTPQMLRTYEARGLVSPARTPGGTRRYSGDDLTRIDEITVLLGDGLNLAGVEEVLRLRAETARLRAEVATLRRWADNRTGNRGDNRSDTPAGRQARDDSGGQPGRRPREQRRGGTD